MNSIHLNHAMLALAVVAAAGGARAAEPGDVGGSPIHSVSEPSSLEDVVAHALTGNAGLRAAREHWRAAIQKVPQAKGWPDPRLSYGYFLENVETRVGPQEHRIGVVQPLPWFGKLRAAGDVAGAEAAAALADVAVLELQVVRDVKDAWFELAWLEDARRITSENISLIGQLEGVAQARFKAGGTLGPVTKAQVELGKLQDRLASLDDMRTPLRARLNALLHRASDASLPVPRNLASGVIELPDESELFSWQAEANPMLEKLSHRIEREDHAVQLARKQGMPELGVGLDYIVTGDARMPGVSDSGKDAVVAMFTVSIPLWRGKYRAAIDEAEARRNAAQAEREGRIDRLASMLKMALYRFRDSERKIDLYGATLLPQARSALNVARQNYESGGSDFLNLIDAQRALLEFELEHQRALANREQALAEIEMLVGRGVGRGAWGDGDTTLADPSSDPN